VKSRNLVIALGCLLLVAAIAVYVGYVRSPNEDGSQIPVESAERMETIRNMAKHWSKQPDYRDSFDPLNPAADMVRSVNNDGGSTDLPIDANGTHELVAAYCGGCHSLNIVTQQHASRQRWEQLLVWMEKKQGMPKLPEKEEGQILDYLTAHFSS